MGGRVDQRLLGHNTRHCLLRHNMGYGSRKARRTLHPLLGLYIRNEVKVGLGWNEMGV
jgi:hypothetical protein